MEKKKRPQSHGMSHEQISELQQAQAANEQEFVTANKNSDFEIPKAERHLVHAEIETKTFDTATGEKTSVPFVQSFYPLEFAQMEKDGAFLGKSVTVIHEGEDLKAIQAEEMAKGDQGGLGEGSSINQNAKKQVVAAGAAAPKAPVVVDWTKAKKPALVKELKTLTGKDVDEKLTAPQLLKLVQDEHAKPKKGAAKTLDLYTSEELKAAYKKAYDEDPSAEQTDADLIVALQDKVGGA